ncbi:MAG: type IX secretion system membrane protein PorP/SprF [Vicingaceae bacterium]|nr:type IX secretion system membrane protein PorP/SprF [Vicingaceae bacterium]
MKGILLILIFLSFGIIGSSQQVPLSSQYMMNRLVVNPAYAGELGFYSASLSYRKQWIGLEGAPSTQNLSIHGPALKGKLGFGLLFFRDIIGVSKENNITGSFAYRIKNDKRKSTLSFGIAASSVFTTNQWSQIVTTAENDNAFSADSPQYIFPDFSAGIYYKKEQYYVGFSIPMFLQHKLEGSSSKYSIENNFNQYNYLLEVGVNFKINDISIKPSIMNRYLPSSAYQFDLNCIIDINNKIGLGASYRTKDAVVGLIQLHVSDQIILGYSYDHSISSLQQYNNGSHELFLRYDFRYKVKSFDPRFF